MSRPDRQTFISKPAYYQSNDSKAASIVVRPGVIVRPDESRELAVAIMNDHAPIVLFTHAQALDFATDIANVLAAQKEQERSNS